MGSSAEQIYDDGKRDWGRQKRIGGKGVDCIDDLERCQRQYAHISHRVFWNSSQSRLNSMPILCLTRQWFFTRHSFPRLASPCSPYPDRSCRVCRYIMNVDPPTCLSFYGIWIDEHAPECGRQVRFWLRVMCA